jgi:hypothetical protein
MIHSSGKNIPKTTTNAVKLPCLDDIGLPFW